MPPPPTSSANITEAYHQGGLLRVAVLTENKAKLDRQAAVRLHCDDPLGTVWQTTASDSETTFLGLSVCKYDIQVSAVGYLTTRKLVDVAGLTDEIKTEIILQRDPSAINLDASGSAESLMPAKATKETQKAIQALKSGNFKESQKHLDAASKLVPSNAQIDFLSGYLAFEQRDVEKAETYLAQATALDPRHVQALTLLGRVRLVRGEFDPARAALEEAVAVAPDDWMPHNLLADAYLKQHQYEQAREQAQKAIDVGRGAGNAAQLVLAEALANLGRNQEGIQAAKSFLQAFPDNPSAPHARDLLALLEQNASSATASNATASAFVPSDKSGADPLLASSDPALPITRWQPPGVDDEKPITAAGVSCPADQVIRTAGVGVEQFVDNVGRFAAVEDLLHERLDSLGNTSARETRKFDYAATISETRPGVLMVDEYRTQRYGLADLPDQIVTKGFAALALVFHPSMRDNFQMTCEGLGDWHGQATWLVHFRQRDDRPSHMQEYIVGANSYPVKLKGRAWITADKFQIVRIESELVNPIAKARFFTEHQIAEYGPVPFAGKNLSLWLPKTADVYLDLAGHRYHRRHSFDHYMLFSVDSQEKIRQAKQDVRGPGSTTPRKRMRWPA